MTLLAQHIDAKPGMSILQVIAGDDIKFTELPPTQTSYTPKQINGNHKGLINKEINNLLLKGIIVECDHEPDFKMKTIHTIL